MKPSLAIYTILSLIIDGILIMYSLLAAYFFILLKKICFREKESRAKFFRPALFVLNSHNEGQGFYYMAINNYILYVKLKGGDLNEFLEI